MANWKKYGEWRRKVYPEMSKELYGQSPWQKRPYEIWCGYKFLPGTFSIGIQELETIEKNIETIKLYKELTNIEEEKQVTVHCSCIGVSAIRIWKSTFLVAHSSPHRSKLIHAENITLYPEWTLLEEDKKTRFTLVFTGLPKDCEQFDLIEDIPEPGGFIVRNIKRNNSDVYLIEV